MTNSVKNTQPEPDQLPFVAPSTELPLFAAFDWLSKGWQDFKTAPGVSLTYGLGLVVISYILAISSWYLGGAVLLISLLSGLVFIAPVLALGLYSVSCQIASGQKPKLAYCIREGKRHLGNELVFSVVLLIVFLVWARAGSAVHIFFPMQTDTQLSDYLTFYAIGSVVGAIFATIVFCASAFSLPMMMDRKADAITAVVTSVNAVLKNKLPMLVWASIIVISIMICFATAFLGMAIIMPLLGFATWHGYKQTINPELWPENKKLSDRNPSADQVLQ
jgi:uncharacterized membrane protein